MKKKMVNNDKKTKNTKLLVMIIAIAAIVISVMGAAYAFFTFSATGQQNSQLVTGDIYMKYTDSTALNLTGAYPSATYDSNKYFEFTVEGKNTNPTKAVSYNIIVTRGTYSGTRTNRIEDTYLKFHLKRKVGNGSFTDVATNLNYSDISSGQTIYTSSFAANTTSNEVHTYRLFPYISNTLTVGGGSATGVYTMEKWNNSYAVVKVNVSGHLAS